MKLARLIVAILRWLGNLLFPPYKPPWEMPRNYKFLRCAGGVTRRVREGS